MSIYKKIKKNIFVSSLFLLATFIPFSSHAEESSLDTNNQDSWKAKVIQISDERHETMFDSSDYDYLIQTLKARVIDGPQEGEIIQIENDFQELSVGDKFYFTKRTVFEGGENSYVITNIARHESLIWLAIIFVIAVVLLGRWQGIKSLIALILSFIAIIFVLLPGILNGWNPLFASFLVAAVVLFSAIFLTHGFNRESIVAYSGTMIAVLLTSLFAVFAVHITKLSGFNAEEVMYLNLDTGGSINFTALLLGAFIIGFLGVLDDIAITQAAIVTELFDSNKNITRKEVFRRAMRIGREHVGALVNTLMLAYTGASLPLILWMYVSDLSFSNIVNFEIFATEIVRIIVGSIGLILTVPIVTLLAVRYLKGYKSKHGHHHHHGHSH